MRSVIVEGQRYVSEEELGLAQGNARTRAELVLLVRDLCLTYMQNPEEVNIPVLRHRAATALLAHGSASLLGQDFLFRVERASKQAERAYLNREQ